MSNHLQNLTSHFFCEVKVFIQNRYSMEVGTRAKWGSRQSGEVGKVGTRAKWGCGQSGEWGREQRGDAGEVGTRAKWGREQSGDTPVPFWTVGTCTGHSGTWCPILLRFFNSFGK